MSQVPPSASSSTSLTATSGLHTPWSHSLSCWLPLLVDAGAGSCRKGMGGSTAGVVDAGLLLLVEMGQSMLLSFSGGNQRCAPHTERMLLYMEHSLERPSGEQPHLSPYRPAIGQCATQAARFLDRAVVLPERQHENGKEDADDAAKAQGGLLHLMVEMGKSGLTSQGKSHVGLLDPLKQQFLNARCAAQGPPEGK